ncbi:SGNH/GDSL hydrolase family protein [Kutzneria albida]|uniref:Lipase n=1 Tax=Kutzneria albida DSM 43870 TaxID=1449976 RepID=W5W553_9PSEU|nr:SGNH/GDSL hydrolase family protein [Kutzneria albida]AHH96022.1 Lipase [Kutzneria albida DSM 43870]
MGAFTALLLSSALLLPAPGPAQTHYVALGDSYAAGVGAGDYDPSSGSCERSFNAYPALWAQEHRDASAQTVACSGASTAEVLNGQLGALGPDTTLVSISIGGNDIGFTEVLTTCVLGSDSACKAKVDGAVAVVNGRLGADLDRTYRAIRDKAPAAKLVVVGYPRLFEDGPCGGGLSAAKRSALNAGADELARVTSERAVAAGAVFADARPVFAGHGVCGAQPWINSVVFPVDGSFHPNAEGQAAYLRVLDAS